eukprot:scaffold257198_cov28-Tisochrysis_lutea.AAC.2
MALSLAIPVQAAWTADHFPQCTPAPDCYPNRRANHRNSELNRLFNKYCSDKGTYWLSKHGYGSAYDVAFSPLREARNVVELGVGDETAASLSAWREYFPSAHFWIVDYDERRFHDEKQYAWASKTKRRHGCFDQGSAHATWSAPRVHAFFGVDSSNQTMLQSLPLPQQLDIIIDDAAHVLTHQIAAIEALWPRLRPGGVYVIEDVTIGALPWLKGLAAADQLARAPTNNTDCGHECFYVQRPAEHPFIKRLVPAMREQHEAREALRLAGANARIAPRVEAILDSNPWYWAITGAHKGGGLDSTIIIRKVENTAKEEARDRFRGGESVVEAAHTFSQVTEIDPSSQIAGWEQSRNWASGLGSSSARPPSLLGVLLVPICILGIVLCIRGGRSGRNGYSSLLSASGRKDIENE